MLYNYYLSVQDLRQYIIHKIAKRFRFFPPIYLQNLPKCDPSNVQETGHHARGLVEFFKIKISINQAISHQVSSRAQKVPSPLIT